MSEENYGNVYSQQGFNLEIPYILELTKLISDKDNLVRKDLADLMGVGSPKVRCFINYAKIASLLTEDGKVSDFGKSMLEIEYNYDYLYSLLYYQFVKDINKGGHLYFSKVVNEVLYNISFQLNNLISIEEIKERMKEYNLRYINEKDHLSYVTRAVKALSKSNTGFGKLGMIRESEYGYEVYSYWPDPLVCAYIIYDNWKDGSVAMKLDKIIKGKYNFGRIFFLDQDTVMGILEDLQQMSYISVETIAGLNQIRINPKKSKKDILEAILDEA